MYFTLLFLSAASVILASPTPKIQQRGSTSDVPDYVTKYAPIQYFDIQESYWLSDISMHLLHTKPETDFTSAGDTVTVEELNNLAQTVYLTSNDNVEDAPPWLVSEYGKPQSSGESAAPSTIITVDKGKGVVHAYYFNFFSYNYGPELEVLLSMGHWGNHVGDWEYVLIRFENEKPVSIYLSAHSGGYAYTWDAITKQGDRPITYIAKGTHANYATTGDQQYVLKGLDVLKDTTSPGFAYDLTYNYRAFSYDLSSTKFSQLSGAGVGGTQEAKEGVDWLYWKGAWGDEQYPEDNDAPDQFCAFGQCFFVSGPTGPVTKTLDRDNICGADACDPLTEAKQIEL